MKSLSLAIMLMLTLCGLAPTAQAMGRLGRTALSRISKFGLLSSFSSAGMIKVCHFKEDKTQIEAGTQQKIFEANKAKLPASLRTFLDDFQSWSNEDKAKIEIVGLSFVISGLNAEKQAPYEGSIGYWIDCRTNTQQQRQLFIRCLKHLQK